MRRIARVLGLGLLGVVLAAAPANAAGKPVMERIVVDETFVDAFLSTECGTPVTVVVSGHFMTRSWFGADGNPVRELNNYALTVTWSSANGSITAKDVGADRATFLNGNIVVIIIGNVTSISIPGQGRIYSDVGRAQFEITFGAPGQEPTFEYTPLSGQHDDNQVEAICSVLGA